MAVEIINSGKNISLDCVDTWLGSEEHQENSLAEDSSVVAGSLFEDFLKNTRNFSNIINPIRLPSEKAFKVYDDNSLDFVFIDAAHDVKNVLKDIANWSTKVKQGGVIAGHDYGGGHVGVNDAVDLYFKEILNVKIQTFQDCSCWLVDKTFDDPSKEDVETAFRDWKTKTRKGWIPLTVTKPATKKDKNKNTVQLYRQKWKLNSKGEMVKE